MITTHIKRQKEHLSVDCFLLPCLRFADLLNSWIGEDEKFMSLKKYITFALFCSIVAFKFFLLELQSRIMLELLTLYPSLLSLSHWASFWITSTDLASQSQIVSLALIQI